MSANDNAQAAMDRLFGVKEPRINIERPAGFDHATPGRNAFYSRALLEARSLFPDDAIARHRFAEREADRLVRMSAAANTASRHSDKVLVDVAFIEVFGQGRDAYAGKPFLIATFP